MILALIGQLAAAQETIEAQEPRIAVLEARLDERTRPPKTPDNSSKPPPQSQKQERPTPPIGRRAGAGLAWAGSWTLIRMSARSPALRKRDRRWRTRVTTPLEGPLPSREADFGASSQICSRRRASLDGNFRL